MKRITIMLAVLALLTCSGVTQAIEMVLIPSGEFEMGDHFDEGQPDEKPLHMVKVGSFYMGKYEVTNQQYCDYLNSALSQTLIEVNSGVVYPIGGGDAYCDTTTSSSSSSITWNGSSFGVVAGKENHPVLMVSWFGAKAYCDYYDYRLPTEAEWEYAARGGEHSPYYLFPWGNTITHDQATYHSYWVGGVPKFWYDVNPTSGYHPDYTSTSPVGSFSPNGYGLYDMSSNVWEWCNDWYSSTYYNTSQYDNPQGPVSGTNCVFRSGSWHSQAYHGRVAIRYNNLPSFRNYTVGFRVAEICEPAEPNIAISPLSHDFGDIELGTSSTVIITISNEGSADLNVSGIALETDFAITSVPPTTVVVGPSETVDVEITYTPTVLGDNSAVLKITSDDPDEPVVEVQLSAAGVEIPPPPSEQIANILAFFDTSVSDGTLAGDGPGSSAEKRLNALRNMIEAAGDLIEGELFEEACQQLLDVYRRMDGQPRPPDFVKGEAVLQLAAMVQELMTSLGCE